MKSVIVSIPEVRSEVKGQYNTGLAGVRLDLPTKPCWALSQSGAARTPLATRAKNAFFT